MLASSDDPDYEVGGDFATACQCEEGAYITNISLRGHIAGSAGDTFDWILLKSPNALLDSIVPNQIHTNNPNTSGLLLVRKMTLAYGAGRIPDNSTVTALRIWVRRQALKRIGQIHEDDKLILIIDNHDATNNMSFRGYGRIHVAEN